MVRAAILLPEFSSYAGQQKKLFLTEDRLVSAYDKLNKIIHAENPIGTQIDLREYMEAMPTWVEWTKNLLFEHKVFWRHHPNVFYWVRMFGGPDGDVECTPIRSDENGQEICPWPDCVQEGNQLYCEYTEGPWGACTLEPIGESQKESKIWAIDFDKENPVQN